MLDPETAIGPGPRGRGLLESVEHESVGAVADGVDRELKPRGICVVDHPVQLLDRIEEQAARSRFVGVGIEERRGPSTHRAIGEDLDGADANPVVAEARTHTRVDERLQGAHRTPHVDAREESAFRADLLVRGQGVDRRIVLDAGDAERGRMRESRLGRAHVHLTGGLRQGFVEEILGVVLEDARGLARGVSNDGPAEGVPGVAIDARGLKRQGVREDHVTVEPVHGHRVVLRDRVDQRPRGERLALPAFVVPVAVQDPGAFREARGVLADPFRELRFVLRVAQVDGEQAEAAVEEVDVRVIEARSDESPLEVDDPGVLRSEGANRRLAPRREHAVARDRESRLEPALLHVDAAVDEDRVGGLQGHGCSQDETQHS